MVKLPILDVGEPFLPAFSCIIFSQFQPGRTTMTQVFISYSRKDISFINRLAADLKNAGLDVWYDVSGIAGSTLAKRERECPAQQPVCDCGAFA